MNEYISYTHLQQQMRVFMNSDMESSGMELIRALYWHLPEGTKP